MWWIPLAMAAGSMADGAQKRKAQTANNMAQAEQSRYAYLTGGPMGQINPVTSSAFGDAAKGGVSGFAMMQGLQNAQGGISPGQMKANTALDQQLEAMKLKNQQDITGQLQGYNPNLG